MFLSIVIPTYNVEKYIRECLDSCINQTFKGEYEIICVDDGSTDNTIKIIEEYTTKNNVTLIKNGHLGPSHARNSGIEKILSGGGYIWFIDSDDLIIPQAIETLSKVVQEQKYDRVIFGAYFFNETFSKEEKVLFANGGFTEKTFNESYCWSSIYKKDFLIENNVLFRENIVYGEDEIFNYEISKCRPQVFYIDKILYCHRNHKYSLMSSTITLKGALSRIESVIQAMNVLKEDVDNGLNNINAKAIFSSRQRLLSFLVTRLPKNLYKEYLKKLKKNKLFSKEYYFVKKGELFVKGNYFVFKFKLIRNRIYYTLTGKILKE